MRAWIAAALLVAGAVAASEPGPGRTDGPEGSEIGRGGYAYHRTAGQVYVEPFLGAAAVDIEPERGADLSETELVYGASVGYMTQDWLGFQVGYGYIGGGRKTSLYSAGVRNILRYDTFNWYVGLDAELYSPDGGGTHFGVVPGVGAEVVLTDEVSAGLQYQHDFVLADDNISINRFTARLRVQF